MFRKSNSSKAQIEELVEEYRQLNRQGSAPTIEEYVSRYPYCDEALRKALMEYHRIAAILREVELSSFEAEEPVSFSEGELENAWQSFRYRVGLRDNPPLPIQKPTKILFRYALATGAIFVLIIGLVLFIQIKKHPLELQAQLVQPSGRGAPSSIFYSGDRLKVSLNVTQKAYIYVVLYDSSGKAQLLFPLPDVDTSNQLEPKRDYLIPPSNWFELDQNTGMETLFILASRHPESDVLNLVQLIQSETSTMKNTYHKRVEHVADILSDGGFVVRTISFEHRARD